MLPWLPLFSQPPALFTSSTADATICEQWQALVDALPILPPFGQITEVYRNGQQQLLLLQQRLIAQPVQDNQHQAALAWCSRLMAELESARSTATALMIGFSDLQQAAENIFQAMDFGFLFDSYRCLFHIGYNVTTETLDSSYYDLLASEARIASYIAIAKGDVPPQHWLHMARPLSALDGAQALLSWSGTMFEYLMPWLLMQHYENTLLYQSCQVAVEHQIAYGRQKNVPWGISESGYYAFDSNFNYQYRAFGVPRLAFKRGQAADLVIAPYASLIALPLAPQAVMQNITRLNEASALSTYGFLRGYRLHRNPAAPGRNTSGGAGVHGSSPGNDFCHAGELSLRQHHGATVSQRSSDAERGTAAARAHPTADFHTAADA